MNVENEQGGRNTWLSPLLTYCKLAALGSVPAMIEFFPSLGLMERSHNPLID